MSVRGTVFTLGWASRSWTDESQLPAAWDSAGGNLCLFLLPGESADVTCSFPEAATLTLRHLTMCLGVMLVHLCHLSAWPAQAKRSTHPVRKASHACTFLQDAYFQQTSRVQKMVLPFQIVTNDTSLCQPGIQERSADIEGKKLVKLPCTGSGVWPACISSKHEVLLLAGPSAC